MSCKSISAELEKLLTRLCLEDFPCGSNGSSSRAGPGSEPLDSGVLLDLLSCPHSPWRLDDSWSPEASELRRLAVSRPLSNAFVYEHIRTIRLVDKGVTDIDEGLLKFSNLEELVLSVNQISEVPAVNLPSSLKTLELRSNRVSDLRRLTEKLLPELEYLSLNNNSLNNNSLNNNSLNNNSTDVTGLLTGRHWPQLVCLDLGGCEFGVQRVLLGFLVSLPRLRSLVLEGNPLALAASYPGLVLDALPLLSCLDATWIQPEDRRRFTGLDRMSQQDVFQDFAAASVTVGAMRGIKDPLMSEEDHSADFPVVSYTYFISYMFLSDDTPVVQKVDGEAELQNAERQTCKDAESEQLPAHEQRYDTSKLPWADAMEFSFRKTHVVHDLGHFKRFLTRGFDLWLQEEKVLWWPAAPDDAAMPKNSRNVKEKKGGKGKESPVKSRDKKRRPGPELVQDDPVRRVLGSAHIPLQDLVYGVQKLDLVCEIRIQQPEADPETLGKQITEEETEEKEVMKQKTGSGSSQKITAASKAKLKPIQQRDCVQVNDDRPESVRVDLSVELNKWTFASDATKLSHQT